MENKITVVIRVDSSIKIGSGHVMRCLTLADQLKKTNIEVSFICAELTGNISDIIEGKGYSIERFSYMDVAIQKDLWEFDLEFTKKKIRSKERVNWLIVDHYGLDISWESGLRSYVKNIIVIDDLANRKHDCDFLLDQNLYLRMEERYSGLVPDHCIQLLGPNYALLRPEFYEAKKSLHERDGNVRRILLFFGGSDPTNETTKAVKAMMLLNRPDIGIDVVVGKANPYKENIKKICSHLLNATFHYHVDNMAQLMLNTDLAIGAGGITTLERCFLGLPTLVVIVADNQKEMAEVMQESGIVKVVGDSKDVTVNELRDYIEALLAQPEVLKEMSTRALQLFELPLYRLHNYVLENL